MDSKTRRLMQELAKALSHAVADIEEMGCTCVDRSTGHQRGCVGVATAKAYDKLAIRACNVLTREEAKSGVCVCGPKDVHYRPAQKD